jgi:hypothetical protein
MVCLETLELIYMSPLRARQKTTLPLALKLWYNPSGANRSCSTLHRTATPLRSRHASADIEASRHAWIPSPPAEPPILVLWHNQVTRRFSGEPPQTPRAYSGCEPLPYTGSSPQLRLAFLATMRPALDPAGHRVPRVRSTCLSTPQRPRKA